MCNDLSILVNWQHPQHSPQQHAPTGVILPFQCLMVLYCTHRCTTTPVLQTVSFLLKLMSLQYAAFSSSFEPPFPLKPIVHIFQYGFHSAPMRRFFRTRTCCCLTVEMTLLAHHDSRARHHSPRLVNKCALVFHVLHFLHIFSRFTSDDPICSVSPCFHS